MGIKSYKGKKMYKNYRKYINIFFLKNISIHIFSKNTYISIYFAFSREFLFLRSIERLVSFLVTVLSIDYILWLANAFIFNAQWIIEQMRFLISSVYWFFFLLLNNCYEKFYSHSLRKPLHSFLYCFSVFNTLCAFTY